MSKNAEAKDEIRRQAIVKREEEERREGALLPEIRSGNFNYHGGNDGRILSDGDPSGAGDMWFDYELSESSPLSLPPPSYPPLLLPLHILFSLENIMERERNQFIKKLCGDKSIDMSLVLPAGKIHSGTLHRPKHLINTCDTGRDEGDYPSSTPFPISSSTKHTVTQIQ